MALGYSPAGIGFGLEVDLEVKPEVELGVELGVCPDSIEFVSAPPLSKVQSPVQSI